MDAVKDLFGEAQRRYARPEGEHISLGKSLRAVIFAIPILILALILYKLAKSGSIQQPTAVISGAITAVVWGTIVSGGRIAAQWERSVVLRLGQFQGIRGPGIFYVI